MAVVVLNEWSLTLTDSDGDQLVIASRMDGNAGYEVRIGASSVYASTEDLLEFAGKILETMPEKQGEQVSA